MQLVQMELQTIVAGVYQDFDVRLPRLRGGACVFKNKEPVPGTSPFFSFSYANKHQKTKNISTHTHALADSSSPPSLAPLPFPKFLLQAGDS